MVVESIGLWDSDSTMPPRGIVLPPFTLFLATLMFCCSPYCLLKYALAPIVVSPLSKLVEAVLAASASI